MSALYPQCIVVNSASTISFGHEDCYVLVDPPVARRFYQQDIILSFIAWQNTHAMKWCVSALLFDEVLSKSYMSSRQKCSEQHYQAR